jgi:hypothetical protein
LLAFRPLIWKFKIMRFFNPQETTPLLLLAGPGSVKMAEIRSEEEEIGDVEVDVKDLIAAKQSGPLPPSFVFGESKVTTNLRQLDFFLQAMDALHWMNKFLLPKRTKLSYFTTSSLAD